MIQELYFDVTVIGAGPAGLAAALASDHEGAKTLLIEREARLGGILKQCIHDGFGLVRFGEKLSGPEYAERFIEQLPDSHVEVWTLSFVSEIKREKNESLLTVITREGMKRIRTRSLILATGCRERTSRQIGVHGRHCAGVLTAGTAQYYTNILGKLPTKRCVILGSGDIGLIMARRLTLEGAKVVGVYEAKPTPSGLMRNVSQCLWDFDIPLQVSKTVTRVIGDARLTAVEIASVDACMCPIKGTEEIIPCDALILSVGLIPENELAESIGVPIDFKTKGAVVDERNETLLRGVFACGNALHVNDLVDYVSESGEVAGKAAASPTNRSRGLVPVECDQSLLYVVPQRLCRNSEEMERVFFFRSARDMDNATLTVAKGEQVLFTKKFAHLRPPEMERIPITLSKKELDGNLPLRFHLEE
ncbi:MAG: pyridine nucleotide-disulfide oxidoreductase [Firmicutes bacterium HGW-Firmicutes-9]|jgi:thioredoxin reductase|nr:MAG: pyridine nucleotide-disulfide oxidoreductase [Firmicutes bacterium HGW-Firmicutes-9]